MAVILVLAQHLLNRFYFSRFATAGPPIGTFGVLIFFVHTCLVLMYSMERSGLEGPPLASNFYIRRIFRIYPLSVLAVLTAVALHLDSDRHGIPGLSHVASIEWGRIVSNLLLVQNVVKPGSIINVLWSLPYEVQMYVFLPILFLWFRKISVQSLCVVWAGCCLLAFGHSQLSWGSASSDALLRLSVVRYFPNFLPGIIAFRIGHVAKIKSFLWLPFILLLVVAFVLIPHAAMGWVLCLVLGISIPFFGEIKTSWLRWISHRIATYSYGIYLSHQFAIWFVSDRLESFPVWIRLAILVVLLVGLPVVLYHAIEKPMIKIGVRLAEKRSTKPAALPAAA